jgi:hypothetical protein
MAKAQKHEESAASGLQAGYYGVRPRKVSGSANGDAFGRIGGSRAGTNVAHRKAPTTGALATLRAACSR